MNQVNDEQIIALIASSDKTEAGFRLLMTTYQRDLYWHIRSIVHRHEDTDDVLQNTFIKVYRHIEGFKQQSSLYTWIYRIATNEALNHIKKEKKHLSQDFQPHQIELRYTDSANGEEISSRLQEAILKLPEKQRAVFNLRYFEEMSYRKMSELLDTSEGALKASYHFAVKKIEAELKS